MGRGRTLRGVAGRRARGGTAPLRRGTPLRHYPTVLRGTACGASSARAPSLHSNEPRRAAPRGTPGVVVHHRFAVRAPVAGGTRRPGMPRGEDGGAGRGARAREAEGVRAAHGAAVAAIVGAVG